MPWIEGAHLMWDQRRAVRAAFPYRWTVENEEQSKRLHAAAGCTPPTRVAVLTDREWEVARTFLFTIDRPARAGRYSRKLGRRVGASEATWKLGAAPRCRLTAQPAGLGVFTLEDLREARGPAAEAGSEV